MFETGSWIV